MGKTKSTQQISWNSTFHMDTLGVNFCTLQITYSKKYNNN